MIPVHGLNQTEINTLHILKNKKGKKVSKKVSDPTKVGSDTFFTDTFFTDTFFPDI